MTVWVEFLIHGGRSPRPPNRSGVDHQQFVPGPRHQPADPEMGRPRTPSRVNGWRKVCAPREPRRRSGAAASGRADARLEVLKNDLLSYPGRC